MTVLVTVALLLFASPDGNVYADAYFSLEDCEAAMLTTPHALRCEVRTESHWISLKDDEE